MRALAANDPSERPLPDATREITTSRWMQQGTSLHNNDDTIESLALFQFRGNVVVDL